jgi:hypothetical protein
MKIASDIAFAALVALAACDVVLWWTIIGACVVRWLL